MTKWLINIYTGAQINTELWTDVPGVNVHQQASDEPGNFLYLTVYLLIFKPINQKTYLQNYRNL